MLPKVVHSTLPFFVHCKFASYSRDNFNEKLLYLQLIIVLFINI